MTPADQHALREALARVINPYAFHYSTPDNFGPDLEMAYFGALQRVALKTADALIAGHLAPYLAAETESIRLKETVEGLLPQKLCGESWGCPDEERVSITVTFGAIRVARSVLATIPPKENP